MLPWQLAQTVMHCSQPFQQLPWTTMARNEQLVVCPAQARVSADCMTLAASINKESMRLCRSADCDPGAHAQQFPSQATSSHRSGKQPCCNPLSSSTSITTAASLWSEQVLAQECTLRPLQQQSQAKLSCCSKPRMQS